MIADALPRLQEVALSRMQSRCLIERVATTTDPSTGAGVESIAAVVYSGPCRVRTSQPSGRDGGSNGTITHGATQVHIPSDAPLVQEGARITITSGRLAGTRLRVVAQHLSDQVTAQRMEVEAWM